MKKILFLAVILLSNVNGNAQSRIDEKMLEFNSRSEKLMSAIGWKKNSSTGKWVSNENVIKDKKISSSNYSISHTYQNFKWLQFLTITKEKKDYYVILYERLAGEYKYPSIYEGWERFNKTYFFLLSVEKYKKIKNQIDLKKGNNVKITTNISGYITDRYKILGGEHLYNEENLLARITNRIERPNTYESCFVLNSQITDGIDILRFRLPGMCDSLEKGYFEVKHSEFKKILIE